ncbi:hypothetical protein HW532_18565 [Kaustia mangrovi]|uniref:Uncharacterized protein n=1 Tax=Kaustia mangrovi TaxID=2593653 RepID=A0A7S8C6W5_9HYPH|nr:hypothetical protein [Kaustia mangrovi]QPC44523.1 hypothetical protein HW532_18565 [Kaustia mangrovi]
MPAWIRAIGRDALLHAAAAAVLTVAIGLAELAFGTLTAWGPAIVSSWFFLRELTQWQARYADNDVRKGWAFWREWSAEKQAEAFVPVAAAWAVWAAIS